MIEVALTASGCISGKFMRSTVKPSKERKAATTCSELSSPRLWLELATSAKAVLATHMEALGFQVGTFHLMSRWDFTRPDPIILGARTLLGAPGLTTSNQKLLGTRIK